MIIKQHFIVICAGFLTFFLLLTSILPNVALAQSTSQDTPQTELERLDQINQLKGQIDAHNQQIGSIESDISKYQQQIDSINKQQETLHNAVSELETSDQKLAAQINLTLNQKSSTELSIQKLQLEIADQENRIKKNNKALEETLQTIQKSDNNTLIESFLANKSISEFWNSVDSLQQFQSEIGNNLATLRELQKQMQGNIVEEKARINELADLEGTLSGQREAVQYAREEKQDLLAATESKESTYQSLLEEKQALKKQFTDELQAYERQLKIVIDTSLLPKPGDKVLSYPVDNFVITQYFGTTEFSKTGAYNGQGHNGVDLGVPIGTPVKAAQSGVVLGTGNTDLTCDNASFGKWVVIRHNNGLSTLYGHLSVIKATEGEQVTLGQVIGYSGNTGYSTGPHVHFTVYATQGMQIGSLQSAACPGATYRIPLADLSAYLNPMDYLR
jgi:murein DD-endopeptidase MepM/ murein hydrolase activator NlpD